MSEPTAARKPMPRLVAATGGQPRPAPAPQAGPQQAQPQPAETATNPISAFIELEIEARQCADLDVLRFAIVNSTRKIAAFDQAFLVEPAAGGGWKLTRASSVSKIDHHAPPIRALEDWLASVKTITGFDGTEPRFFNLDDDAAHGSASPSGLCPHAFWLPVRGREGRLHCVLLALKKDTWRPQATALLMPLAGAYAHAWAALEPKHAQHAERAKRIFSRKKLAIAAAVLLSVAAFVPVPMSSLAPAEVVAMEPALITAPMDGVIDKILAPPGALVEKDAPIVQIVDVKLRSDFDVARRNKEVAHARYFKIVQSATANQSEDQKDLHELASAKAELDVAAAEFEFARDMLSRSLIKAPRAGLLIYSAASDWSGKPVRTGERILEIGDPAKTEVKIDLPVSDAVSLRDGGHIALFLDGDPLTAIPGEITRANYRPTANAEHQLVYKVHARFGDGHARRIGLRGVARVSSHDVPLWFYLFRRPISGLRQRFGL